MMKICIGLLLLTIISQTGHAQYYYKDLVVTGQTAAQWKRYQAAKVRSVKLISLEADGQPSRDFQGGQELNADGTRITTHTKSTATPESWILASYTPAGWPAKIVDTSDTYKSISDYRYDAAQRLTSITNISTQTDNHLNETELHAWSYDAAGKPARMLKIRNANDTTFVTFIIDEKGHVAEERAVRNGYGLPAVYYYYDDQGRLTDVVRYNKKAARLLPDYIFEYGEDGRLSSMLVVPEGSNDYQKWMYAYDGAGLKAKESCFNRQKQLVGSIEYQYNVK